MVTKIINARFIMLLALLGCLASLGMAMLQAGAVVTAPTYHGLERHGDGAQMVIDCLSRNGSYAVYHSSNGNRELHVCVLPDGRLGVQVLDKLGRRITEFVNRCKIDQFEKFDRYMRNGGNLPGPLP